MYYRHELLMGPLVHLLAELQVCAAYLLTTKRGYARVELKRNVRYYATID